MFIFLVPSNESLFANTVELYHYRCEQYLLYIGFYYFILDEKCFVVSELIINPFFQNKNQSNFSNTNQRSTLMFHGKVKSEEQFHLKHLTYISCNNKLMIRTLHSHCPKQNILIVKIDSICDHI